MKEFEVTISQNGWEYKGYAYITCDTVKKISDDTILVDDKIKIQFDEEISDNIKEVNSKDKNINMDGYK